MRKRMLWILAGVIGAVMLTIFTGEVSAAVSAASYTAKTTSNANLRKEMKMEDGNVLKVIPKGTVLVIEGREKDNWFKVTWQEAAGYVKGGLLTDNTDILETTSNANLRSAMDTSDAANILAVIPKKDRVEVISREKDGWIQVCYKGKAGYVSASLLREIPGKTIDLKKVKFENITVYYNGRYHSLPEVSNLPKDVKVSYSITGKKKDIGVYTVKATFAAKEARDKLLHAEARTANLTIAIKERAIYKVKSLRYRILSAKTNGKGTVRVIGPEDKKKIKTLKVPNTVTIGGVKFNVTEIGKKSFMGCKKLKEVRTGSSVKIIRSRAFADCKKLAYIKVGESVKSIGIKAFDGDKKLAKITIRAKKLKEVGKKAFRGISGKAVIRVPKEKKAKYQKLLAGKGQGAGVVIK